MALIITYQTFPSHQKEPIQMCGAFENMEKFKRFAEIEGRRNCYRDVPFVVEKTREIPDSEYRAMFQYGERQ